jgi:hypothetical protein
MIFIGLGFVLDSWGTVLVLIVFFRVAIDYRIRVGGFNIESGRRVRLVRKENKEAYSVRFSTLKAPSLLLCAKSREASYSSGDRVAVLLTH